MKKTYSRETFWIMMFWLGYLTFRENTELVEILIWPVMTFGLAAFGFKQSVVHDFVNPKKNNA